MTCQTHPGAALVIVSTVFVSGSAVCAQTDRAHWSMYLRPDGVLIRAGMSVRENGTWKIEKNKLCMSNPSSKLLNCSYVWMAGERISLRMKEKADADDFDAFVENHKGN